jgi:hypothetical protein
MVVKNYLLRWAVSSILAQRRYCVGGFGEAEFWLALTFMGSLARSAQPFGMAILYRL